MNRPELYVPLSVRFATGKTGTAIQRRYGLEGLAVWAAFLAACKLNRPEGEITYASEPEGWGLLGLTGHEPEFTLDEFFRFTGQLKKTRRTRSGHVSYVVCTPWGRWTKAAKREKERQRKSSIRAQSKRDTERTEGGTGRGQKADLELELELDIEKTQTDRPKLTTPEPDDIDFGDGDPANGRWSTAVDIPRLSQPTVGLSD